MVEVDENDHREGVSIKRMDLTGWGNQFNWVWIVVSFD